MIQPTETFINAQLLSDGKFYNKIDIIYNTMLQMYFLYADGVYKAESVDEDSLKTMVGTVLGERNYFTIEREEEEELGTVGFSIRELPFKLITIHQHLVYQHGDIYLCYKTSDIGYDIFLTESDARKEVVKRYKECIEYATDEISMYTLKIKRLNKGLQYYEGENK